MRFHRAFGLIALVGLLLAASAQAVIMVAIPLGGVVAECKFIVTAKVESLDPEKFQMVLAVTEAHKGKPAFTKMPVLLQGDDEGKKGKQVPELLKRLKVDLPIVLFITPNPGNASEFRAFGYSEGTWFAMSGVQPKDAETPLWAWGHFEPYLRKTYKGSTAEMRELIGDVLAGKKKAPPVDGKVPPGLGPVLEQKKCAASGDREVAGSATTDYRRPHGRRSPVGGPLLGVIPSVLVGGPLAFLAMLFPAVFGGLIIVARRWLVALTVASTNSTLYLLNDWLDWKIPASSLWLTMTLLTFLGIVWAWQRYTTALAGTATAKTVSPLLASPRSGELISLLALSVACLGLAYFFLPLSLGRMSVWDKTLAVIFVGVGVAAVYVGLVFWRSRGKLVSAALPGEGICLLAMLVASIAILPTFTVAGAGELSPNVVSAPLASEGVPTKVKLAWRFVPGEPSWIASSPLVAGNRVYVGVVHGQAFRNGAVYSVDLGTGKVVAKFDNGGKMQDVFCSPTVAEGCVYVGEGFHQHKGCKLYCLDAETLEKKWEFKTESHTESSPCVVDGKVYFGAGDHGLYCLDAKTGKEIWHLEALHIDANPLVADGKVYIGSGMGEEQAYREGAFVCLDATTGKEEWRTPMTHSTWGGACRAGDLVIFGIGNGNFLTSEVNEKSRTGSVLALNAKTGQRIWQHDMKDGIHVRLSTDGVRVWAASRDQRVVCLNASDGKKVWEQDLGNAIVASPALVPYLAHGERYSTALAQLPGKYPSGASLIVAAAGSSQEDSGGQVTSLDAHTGAVQWSFDVAKDADTLAVALFSSPAVVVTVEAGVEKRRILFGCGLNNFTKGILYCLEDERKPRRSVWEGRSPNNR